MMIGDGSAVGGPGRAGDVRGPFRAQEDDHRGDLLGLRHAAERPALRHLLEHLVATLADACRPLVGQAAFGQPAPASRSGRA